MKTNPHIFSNTKQCEQPHIIAIYNTLRQARHPLYTFLRQTTRDTLLLNCELSSLVFVLFSNLFAPHSQDVCPNNQLIHVISSQGVHVDPLQALSRKPLEIINLLLELASSCSLSRRCGQGTASLRRQAFPMSLQAEDLPRTFKFPPICTVRMG